MNESAVQLSEAKTLPQGWRWVSLSDVCGEAKTRDPRLSPEASFRYVDISSIDATRKQVIGTHTIIGKDAPSRARQVLKANDILVATTRPNLNAVALVPAELDDEICSTGFCVLRPTSQIDPLFLFFFVQTNDFVKFVSGEVRGMLYPAVTDGHVRATSIPLPPLPEQKRIAAKIQEIMAETEHAHTACEARLETANALPKAYLRRVFESEEAKKWERRRLGEVCELAYGSSLPERDRVKGDVPVYGSNGVVGYHSVPITSKPAIIIGRKGSIGQTHYSDVACWPIDTTYYIDASKTSCDVLWLFFLLRWLRLDSFNRATGVPGLNRNDAYAQNVPLPPLPEQKRIAVELRDSRAGAEKLKADIVKQLEAIKALPKAILRKAFSGEL